jgi:hypothetical protein
MFDHSVVIIDEAHNMVSRIVNKIQKKRAKPSLNKSTATILYEQLLTAVDVKIVLCRGRPS